jgi:hypothetical protein
VSFTDPEADNVQPDEGQGDGGASAPYAEYLSRLPEEVRGDVEPVFKDWDANVTRRFQDASEYRKQWEPYEGAGVKNYDPETVQGALAFIEAAQNEPASIKQWYQTYAEQNGLADEPAALAEPPAPQFDEYGLPADTQQVEKLLNDRFAPFEEKIQAIAQWQQERVEAETQQQRDEQAQQQIDSQFAELEKAHGEFDKELLAMFALKYADTDPDNAINRGFQDMQTRINAIEKQALQGKVNAPAAAEGGGVPDVTAEKVSTFAQAEEIARQFLRNSREA